MAEENAQGADGHDGSAKATGGDSNDAGGTVNKNDSIGAPHGNGGGKAVSNGGAKYDEQRHTIAADVLKHRLGELKTQHTRARAIMSLTHAPLGTCITAEQLCLLTKIQDALHDVRYSGADDDDDTSKVLSERIEAVLQPAGHAADKQSKELLEKEKCDETCEAQRKKKKQKKKQKAKSNKAKAKKRRSKAQEQNFDAKEQEVLVY